MTTKPVRIAWICGGASGICLEVARSLALGGHRVVVVDRDMAAIQAIGEVLPDRVMSMSLDVCDEHAVEEAVASVPRAEMPDILVNGIGGDTRAIPFDDLRETDLMAAVRSNVQSAFTMTRLCAPVMRDRGWGRVVNLASIAGRTYSLFSNAAYVAAKAAVVGYTQQCAWELAGTGVTVNAVAPGPIATRRVIDSWDGMTEDRRRSIHSRLPTGRHGSVEEAAAGVLFFCGEDAGYAIGTVLDLNGGLHI